MSFAQVKAEVFRLKHAERRKLLRLLLAEYDPKWLVEMERRKSEMKAGRKVSKEDALRLLGIAQADITIKRIAR